jgi:hypothetical protein
VSVTPLPLHLRPGAREWYGQWLAREHPELVPHYRDLFARGSYPPHDYQRQVAARVRTAARRHGVRTGGGDSHRRPTPPPPPAPAAPGLW